jgi:fatty-acyl-CoA synthase
VLIPAAYDGHARTHLQVQMAFPPRSGDRACRSSAVPEGVPTVPDAELPVSRTELTPLAFLRRSAAVFGDRTAVVHGSRSYSYAEVHDRVNRAASALVAAGLRRGDRVAVLAPNCPAALEAHYFVPAAGGVLVTVNTRLSPREITYILGHSGASRLFVDESLAGLVEPGSVPDVVAIGADGTCAYEAMLAAADPAEASYAVPDENDPISVNYTSGTTGDPKGVVYTHRGAYLNALGQVVEAGLGFDTVFLWTLPMFHCNGWCFTWAVTAVGGVHVCPGGMDPDELWQLIDEHGVTHYNGAPTVHTAVVNSPRAHRVEGGLTVAVAGAAPTPTLLARMRELDFRPRHVYGLTETYGPHTVREWQPSWSGLDAAEIGRVLACQGHEYVTADPVRVVDGDLRDVPADGTTLGEVLMRGNNVSPGYFADPAATAAAFAGGWFRSGDLAVRHPDGGIEIRDRKKDIIISGGENISTIEVEGVLAAHPAVLECAVVAVEDDYWGERPVGFVTLRAGADATSAELIAHCRDRLAHFKCPSAVLFGDLPRTSTGKVRKTVLRETVRTALGTGRPE